MKANRTTHYIIRNNALENYLFVFLHFVSITSATDLQPFVEMELPAAHSKAAWHVDPQQYLGTDGGGGVATVGEFIDLVAKRELEKRKEQPSNNGNDDGAVDDDDDGVGKRPGRQLALFGSVGGRGFPVVPLRSCRSRPAAPLLLLAATTGSTGRQLLHARWIEGEEEQERRRKKLLESETMMAAATNAAGRGGKSIKAGRLFCSSDSDEVEWDFNADIVVNNPKSSKSPKKRKTVAKKAENWDIFFQ